MNRLFFDDLSDLCWSGNSIESAGLMDRSGHAKHHGCSLILGDGFIAGLTQGEQPGRAIAAQPGQKHTAAAARAAPRQTVEEDVHRGLIERLGCIDVDQPPASAKRRLAISGAGLIGQPLAGFQASMAASAF